jgi:hypothetical protein
MEVLGGVYTPIPPPPHAHVWGRVIYHYTHEGYQVSDPLWGLHNPLPPSSGCNTMQLIISSISLCALFEIVAFCFLCSLNPLLKCRLAKKSLSWAKKCALTKMD